MELNDANYVEPKEITDCETNKKAREKLEKEYRKRNEKKDN